MRNKILLYAGVALLAGILIGLYAGYKVGWWVRDYQAARETIARDAELEATNAELQELRLKMALINADLAWMVGDVERRLGVGQWPAGRPSGGDRP